MSIKTATDEIITRLNAAEEILGVLDQNAGNASPLAIACRTAYERIEHARDEEARNWNDMIDGSEQKVYRCSEAAKPYHSVENGDGPCDVWSTDETCSLHIAIAEEQLERAGLL